MLTKGRIATSLPLVAEFGEFVLSIEVISLYVVEFIWHESDC